MRVLLLFFVHYGLNSGKLLLLVMVPAIIASDQVERCDGRAQAKITCP